MDNSPICDEAKSGIPSGAFLFADLISLIKTRSRLTMSAFVARSGFNQIADIIYIKK